MTERVTLTRHYSSRQEAKRATLGIKRAFLDNSHIRIYIRATEIWLECVIPASGQDVALGALIHGLENDELPAITECHEFYQGAGISKFQPYYGRRR